LVATTLSHQEISLSWTGSTDAGGSGLLGYNIYRDGGATPIATVAGTTHIDGNLIANTTYIYQVSAIDGANNESGLSNISGATTQLEPGTGVVSGVVKDAVTLMPIEGALVTLQTTTTQTTTALDGRFSFITASGTDLKIVGAIKGYYNASVATNSPATDVEILLAPVTIGTNASYELVHPDSCAICHPDQKAEWDNSAMATAGINTWVHDIYDGNGTPGGMGGFVYTRDSVHAGTNPNSECAACHQPDAWIQAGFSGRLQGPGDIGYPSHEVEHGISCETCHKIANIDTQKIDFPGIFPGAVDFNLPELGTQVQYGGLPDVDYNAPDTMEPSYQPQLMAEVCGACHQDKNDPNQTGTFDGVTSEPTYTEWLQSPYGTDPGSPSYTTCIDCHMPPSGQTVICTFDPLTRDTNTVRTHAIEGTTAEYLENAVELSMQTQLLGNVLQVDVTIDNSLTGHHVPTGVTIRNMILLVEAWEEGQDPLNNPLVHTGTQVVHDLGGIGNPENGYFAGLPGKFYAKVNHDATLQGPTFFTDATGILFDNRIPALGTDATSYTFTVPDGSDTVQVRARLIYRRAFRFLVDAKGWTLDGHGNPLEDIAGPNYGHLMESVVTSIYCPGCMDFSTVTTIPFLSQDIDGSYTVLDGGASIRLDNNTWRQTQGAYSITPNTMLAFDFESSSQGEVHGIGFHEDGVAAADRIFRIYGTQIWGIGDYANYAGVGVQHYDIPIGQYYTATGAHLVLVNDNDFGIGSDSTFSNIRLYEYVPPATPPEINNPGYQFSQMGDSVSVVVSATDVNGDSLTFSATNLPPGLSISGDGTITGIVTTLGTYNVTVTVDDGNGGTDSASFDWFVCDPAVDCSLNFNTVTTSSYSNQDKSINVSVADGGATLVLANNTWRQTDQTFVITPDAVLEFDFQSDAQGEVQGIGFDEDADTFNADRIFKLYGTQNWGILDFNTYPGDGSQVHYQIPVGLYYTGTAMRLVFANDDDSNVGSNSRYSNVRVIYGLGGNLPPTISSPGNQTTELNSGVNLTVVATDPNFGDILSFSEVGLPAGLSLNSNTGTITGIVTTLGTYNVTVTVDDGNGGTDSASFDWFVCDPTVDCSLNFNTVSTSSYSNQDRSINVSVADGGATLVLANNTWRQTDQTFNVTPNTVIEFDFQSDVQGEVQGIGFDEDADTFNADRIFKLYGTQNWGILDFNTYPGDGSQVHYIIPVGQYYTGIAMRLVFANDDDSGVGSTSRYSNVRIHE
jgi:mono/diheme cytochrome c family protein